MKKQQNTQTDIQKQYYQVILTSIKDNPQDWSAKWFGNKKSIEKSIKNQKSRALVYISDGEILSPIKLILTKEQKNEILPLIKKIVERDELELFNEFKEKMNG